MKYLPFLCLFSLSLSPLIAQDFPQTITPQWTEDDRNKVLRGEWFSEEVLLPLEEDTPDPEVSVITVEDGSSDDDSLNTSIPPDNIPQYAPADINQQLIDPQCILTEQERMDIARILMQIKGATGLSIYLTVFDKGQKIPPALNAPALSRKIFGDRTSLILVEYHRSNFLETQIIYSNDLGAALDDEKKKSLFDAAQKKAAEYTEDSDRLWHLLYAIGEQVPYIRTLVKNLETTRKINIPDITYDLPVVAPKENAKETKWMDELKEFWKEKGIPVLSGFLIICALVAYICYRYSRRIYPLYDHHSPGKKRLGAPYGTNTARVLYYSGQIKKPKKEEDLLKDFFNIKQ